MIGLYIFGFVIAFFLGTLSLRANHISSGGYMKATADNPEMWLLYALFGFAVAVVWPLSLLMYLIRSVVREQNGN